MTTFWLSNRISCMKLSTMFRLERQNGFANLPLDTARRLKKTMVVETRRCWVTSDPEFLAYMDPDQDGRN